MMTDTFRQHLPRYSIGLTAMAVSAYFLSTRLNKPVVVIASLFFLVICATDTLKTKIPNLACLFLVISGCTYQFHAAGTEGLLTALGGLQAGLFLLIIPYLMGGMGAGDVKAMASLGSLLGAAAIFQVFLYTAIIGGIMALFHYLLDGKLFIKIATWKRALHAYWGSRKLEDMPSLNSTEKLKFPYAAAIALGYFAHLSLGDFFELIWGTFLH